jgi:hypothetical protein
MSTVVSFADKPWDFITNGRLGFGGLYGAMPMGYMMIGVGKLEAGEISGDRSDP